MTAPIKNLSAQGGFAMNNTKKMIVAHVGYVI